MLCMPVCAAYLIELLAKLGWKQLRQSPPHSRFARGPGQPLDLRVPALHTIVQIRRQNPDVDGLDDVLAELLQPLVLLHLVLQRTVQPRVFNRDADISRQRGQQLHVVARKEIALVGAAQPQVRDGAPADCAREVVGQIQFGNRPAHRDRPVVRLPRPANAACVQRIDTASRLELRKLRSSSCGLFGSRSLRLPIVMCSWNSPPSRLVHPTGKNATCWIDSVCTSRSATERSISSRLVSDPSSRANSIRVRR